MHIPPFDNQNKAIIDIHDLMCLNLFQRCEAEKEQVFSYQIPGYETCIVPATGRVDVEADNTEFGGVGNRKRMSGMVQKVFMCQPIRCTDGLQK